MIIKDFGPDLTIAFIYVKNEQEEAMNDWQLKNSYTLIFCIIVIAGLSFACQSEATPADIKPVPTNSSPTPLSQKTATMDLSVTFIELKGTKGPIYSLAWSPNGKMLTSAGFARIRIWDAQSLEEIEGLEDPQSFVWGVAWYADSSGLAAASQHGLWVWPNIKERVGKQIDDGSYLCVSLSPDQSLVAAGTPSGKVFIWDINSNQRIKTIDGISAVIGIAWAPNGEQLATGNQSGQIHVYSVSTWEVIDAPNLNSKNGGDVNGLAWSPDGKLLAVARQNATVLVWDSSTDKVRFVLEGHKGWVRGLAWSPDGKELASVGQDGMLKIWELAQGKLIHDQKISSDSLWSVAWSSDSKRIAVGTGIYQSQNSRSSIWIWPR